MGRSPNSDPDLREEGAFEGIIERSAGPRAQAFGQNLGRNVRVMEVLAYVALLKGVGKLPAGKVTCARPERPSFSSSSGMTRMGLPTGPMLAAHFVPGTIRNRNMPLWDPTSDSKCKGHIEGILDRVGICPRFTPRRARRPKQRGQGLMCSTSRSLSFAVDRARWHGRNAEGPQDLA
jgi:hypothetical protein